MLISQKHRVLFRLCTLCILIICLWLFSGAYSQNLTQSEKQITTTLHPLQSENGTSPVEIRCEADPLLMPSRFEGFSCVLKNNTNKNITAANLTYSVLFDSNGTTGKDTHSLTILALTHPDFRELYQPIAPRTERIIRSAGKVSYEAAVIKGLEVGVDYVEFEDGTALGPNQTGSAILVDMREGAKKYKKWLAQEHIKQAKSVSPCISLLQSDQPLPNVSGEFEFKNSDEKNGAKAYRTRLKKICDTQGAAEAEKYLLR